MTARAFLVRGLLAGLLAGFATFFVAHQVGEPHVETAIALETADPPDHAHAGGEPAGHTHEDGAVVSRFDQRTWGLLTGALTIGVALGGLVALVAAGTAGRIRGLGVRQSTAVVVGIGFVAVALVPFLKYPANPPAVGAAETIGARTGDYFGFVLVSVVAAVLATVLVVRLLRHVGTYAGVVIGLAAYVVVVVVAGQAFPTVNEIGDFPADVLWYFRRASILTLASMWGMLGVLLVGFLGRLADQETALSRRRELAASL